MLLGILLAAIILVCVALVFVILLQRSEGGVLGMSGGGPGNFMSARGTGDLLTRTTQILAAVFFILCLVMTLVTGHLRRENSLTSKLKDLTIAPPVASSHAPAQTGATPQTAPQSAPIVPAAPAPASDGLNLFGSAPAGAPRVQPAPAAAPAVSAAKPAVKAAVAKPAAPKVAKAKPAAASPASSAEPAPAPSSPPASSAAPAAPPAGR
ncbi:MAG: preprotein translocase subunit SecG [Caulobacteraceae bacterium]|nr:preprotein translocase subunit SecG [Caulobacteraceae bacterium]